MPQDSFGVFFEQAAHDEDSGLGFLREAGGGHCFAECCAFGDVGDSEPLGSCACEHGSAYMHCAVAAGVGFDDGEDPRCRGRLPRTSRL